MYKSCLNSVWLDSYADERDQSCN